jgi:hypothetical protein
MQRRLALGVAIVAALMIATSALAQPAPSQSVQTITATGTGQSRVLPKERRGNASIVAAVAAARKASIAAALRQAHEYALEYAKESWVGRTTGHGGRPNELAGLRKDQVGLCRLAARVVAIGEERARLGVGDTGPRATDRVSGLVVPQGEVVGLHAADRDHDAQDLNAGHLQSHSGVEARAPCSIIAK